MITFTNILLSLILLSIIFALNSSRLKVLISIMTLQGVIISIIPLFVEEHIDLVSALYVFITFVVKGILIPWFLLSILKKAKIKKEIEPIIGYNFSMMMSLVIIVCAVIFGKNINFPTGGHFLGITAIATIASGMFLLVSRRKSITQVIGYLMMENGIYLIGTTLAVKSRYIVEFGVLLDILIGVMIMVIVLQKINVEFSTLNSKNLKNLKD